MLELSGLSLSDLSLSLSLSDLSLSLPPLADLSLSLSLADLLLSLSALALLDPLPLSEPEALAFSDDASLSLLDELLSELLSLYEALSDFTEELFIPEEELEACSDF